MKLSEVRQRLLAFFQEELGVEARVRSLTPRPTGEAGWESLVETYEESGFMKSIGVNAKVMDKNRYRVTQDPEGEIIAYVLLDEEDSTGA